MNIVHKLIIGIFLYIVSIIGIVYSVAGFSFDNIFMTSYYKVSFVITSVPLLLSSLVIKAFGFYLWYNNLKILVKNKEVLS